jgi:hypothetical protein
MQRLFQDTEVSKRLGIDWNGQELQFVAKENEIFNLLREIVTDFTRKENKLMVKDIYHPEDRAKYINDFFESRGFKEPTPINNPIKPKTGVQAAGTSTTGAPKYTARAKASWDRKRVIQPKAGLPTPTTETKLNNILVELTSKIDVREAPIAAGILVRLVLEQSVEHYANNNEVDISNDKLHVCITKVAGKMKALGKINKKQFELLNKMRNSEELISVHTLNAWVHHSTYTPEPRHVCTLWDNIYFFLCACWK